MLRTPGGSVPGSWLVCSCAEGAPTWRSRPCARSRRCSLREATRAMPGHWARALWTAGQREDARLVLDKGAQTRLDASWERLLAKARCERKLGYLERASRTLVAADDQARVSEGAEPDILVELGDLYFEADGEVDLKVGRESPAVLYKNALQIHPTHERGLARAVHACASLSTGTDRAVRPRKSWASSCGARPRSVPGLLAGLSADLDDGQLVSARERLEILRELAPAHRQVRTLEAALAWIEHRREECEQILSELHASDPADGRPEREVGRTLCELYRFAEGRPFPAAFGGARSLRLRGLDPAGAGPGQHR